MAWNRGDKSRLYHQQARSRAKGGVGKPGLFDAGCWAEKRLYTGSLAASFVNCGCRPRPGHLTCRHHADREEAAQELKSRLAGKES